MEPKKPALRSKSESEEPSGSWRPTKRQVLWVIGMVVALLTTALLIVNLHPEIWKGLLEERTLKLIAIGVSLSAIIVLLAIGGAASSWTGFRRKTVWDLLQLLIVPLALAVVGFLFTMQQDIRQQHIENQRAEAERDLAVQRAQDEALQAYLSQMSSLLLERDLRVADKDSEVSTLARARTVTVLQRLDADRNQSVIRFLNEARLTGSAIGLLVEADLQGSHLEGTALLGADLSGAELSDANLSDADLSGAELSEAKLKGAILSDANLSNANLSDANLSNANLSLALLPEADLSGAALNRALLSDAILSEAKLKGANLSEANLRRAELNHADMGGGTFLFDADLRRAELNAANLRGAYLIDAILYDADLSGANLSDANLRYADLSDANLIDANLSGANLSGTKLIDADLCGVDLSYADLSGADPRGAKRVTNEQLEQQVSTLEGATMPNGQKYEEWLKDKKAREEGG